LASIKCLTIGHEKPGHVGHRLDVKQLITTCPQMGQIFLDHTLFTHEAIKILGDVTFANVQNGKYIVKLIVRKSVFEENYFL